MNKQDCIYYVYRNYNGSWVIHGLLGVKVFYFFTKRQAEQKYLDNCRRNCL